MGTVTFYHHERADRARRTGLDSDDRRGLEQFIPGDEDDDPTLRWYVDVRCEVKSAPQTKTTLAEWLEHHHDIIRTALESAADRLFAGMDIDWAPWSLDLKTSIGKVCVSITAQRRIEATQIGKHLRELLERDWPGFLARYVPDIAELQK